MGNQRWWIQTADDVLGPISPERLQQLAANRAIGPDTLISKDGTRWLPARKVRGLLPDPARSQWSPLSPPPKQDPNIAAPASRQVRDTPESQQNPSAVDLH